MNALPEAVIRHLEREGLAAQACAVLSFDGDWTLLRRSGAQERLGLAETSDERLSEAFREVCIGLSKVRGSFLPQVELPTGGVADLHLVAEAALFHAVLIDVRHAVEQARAHQQAFQEAKLELHERKRELLDARARLKKAQLELFEAQASACVQKQLAQMLRWQQQAVTYELEHEISSLATRPEGLKLALLRMGTTLSALQPPAAQEPGAALDLEALTDRITRGAAALARARNLGFELRTERRSTAAIRLRAESVEQIALAAISQALWRSTSGRVEAVLRWDGAVLRLSVSDRAPELENAERQQLWEERLPREGDAPAATALFALGHWLKAAGGRTTIERLQEGGNQLTLSLVQRQQDGEVTERMPSGGRIWLCGHEPEVNAQLVAQLEPLGFHLETRTVDGGLLESALLHPPNALLLNAGLAEASRLAYRLKGRGFSGRIVAIGATATPLPANSGFDAQVVVPSPSRDLLHAIRGPLPE